MIGSDEFAIKNISNKAILVFFILLSLFVWIDPFAFFRSDDWAFIRDFSEGKSFKDYALVAYGSHVMPLSQLIYSCELTVFGKNALCFQIVSVVLWGCFSFVFYLLLNELSDHKNSNYIALLIAVAMCWHPNFSDIIYWIFQQCMVFHLLFQALTILYYFKYLKEDSTKNLGLFVLFLLVQNYFFGNGVLFPMLFIMHYSFNKRPLHKFVLIVFIIQLLFILIQKQFSQQDLTLLRILQNSYEIIMSFCKLLYVSTVRFFFVKHIGGNILALPAFGSFGYLCWLAFKKQRGYFIFVILYLLVVSAAISIGRDKLYTFLPSEIHYYYTILLFSPLFILLFLAISDLTARALKVFSIVLTLYLGGFFLINIQVKRIFSHRNFKNREILVDAVKYGKPNYYPYDDPMYSNGQNLYLDNFENPSVQRSLQKNSNFEADSAIVNYLQDYKTFILDNHIVIENYKYLEERSWFDLDMRYEQRK